MVHVPQRYGGHCLGLQAPHSPFSKALIIKACDPNGTAHRNGLIHNEPNAHSFQISPFLLSRTCHEIMIAHDGI